MKPHFRNLQRKHLLAWDREARFNHAERSLQDMTKVRSSTGLDPFSPVEPRKHEASITTFLGQCFDYEELLLETAD